MLSEAKTLVTHARTERARFLGYDVGMAHSDSHRRQGRRTVNGMPILSVPRSVVQEWIARRTQHGKPRHRTELLTSADYDIVVTYNMEFQGLANYYLMAYDVAVKMNSIKWVYQQSLVKTLALKHKQTATWVYRRYYRRLANGRKAITVEVPREGRAPLVATFGAKPIRFDPEAVIEDRRLQLLTRRNELVTRLLADQCELCGGHDTVEVHHIRKLKDLKRRYAGRRTPPAWVVRMIEKRRKTLVVCSTCHQAIHAGTYDGPELKEGFLESRIR